MIDTAQFVAHHQQHGEIQRGHEIEHIFLVVKRHMRAARPLNEREVCLAHLRTTGQGELSRIQMFSGGLCGQMRGAGRAETA